MSAVSAEAPFMGLRFFDERHAHVFFGRDEQVDDLLDKVNTARSVGVIGPSGCGKSSLVRAGLIPALHSVGRWRVATSRPRDNPIRELAASVEKACDTSELELTLRRGPLGLLEASRQAGLDPAENLLVIIDQFEELFRFERKPGYSDEAAAFVKLLLEATRQREIPIHVLLTMRSDYLGNCGQFRDLPERLNEGLYLVPRMRRDQLEQAITGPVRAAGAQIAPRLLQRLLNDVGDDPDQLPVLQHALLRTWTRWRERGATGPLDLDDCTSLQNALKEHAEEIYQSLPTRRQEITEIIFRCLTEVDQAREIRRPTAMSVFADVCEAPLEEVRAVVDAFRADGVSFLNPEPDRPLEPDTRVDITHESLIRQWTRLREWALEEAADREVYLSTEKRASQAKGEDDYLKGVDLGRATQWLERRPPEAWANRYGGDHARTVAFIRGSQEKRNRDAAATLREAQAAKRRAFALAGFSLSVAVVIAVLGILFWNQRRTAIASRQVAESLSVRAEAAREQADAEKARAQQAERNTADVNKKLESSVEEQRSARAEAEGQRFLSLWQSLARESVRDSASQISHDRAALLARQAMLIHGRTSNQAQYLVEDALQQAARLDPFIHNILPYAGELRREYGPVYSVAFSPDGARLASAGQYSTVRVWDLRNADAQPMQLGGHDGIVFSVAFSLDGTRLASAGSDRRVQVWNLRSPDTQPVVLEGHQSDVRSVAFAPDGMRLASASADSTVRVWDLRNPGAQPTVLRGHESVVLSVAFSPNGMRLGSAGADRSVRVWDLNNPGARPMMLQGHQDTIRSVAFSTDGTRLASAGDDSTSRVWDLRNPSTPPALLQNPSGVLSVAFSPDGTRIASAGSDRRVRVWDLRNPGTQPRLLDGHESSVVSVVFSPDGARLASGSLDGTARVWDVRDTGVQPVLLQSQQGEVRSVAFSPDGRRLASGGTDQRVRLWDLRNTSSQPVLLQGHENNVSSVSFSPDGTRLASASADSTVRVWDLRNASAQPVLLQGHTGGVRSVAFSPDGTRVASAADDSIVRVWNLRNSGTQPLLLHGHLGAVSSVAFSPDGARLASAGDDGTVRVWDPRNPDTRPIQLRGHANLVLSVAFSPDGTRLASAGSDRGVRLWDLRNPDSQPVLLQGHELGVRSVGFSPDGARLASAGDDHTVRVWDLRSTSAQPVLLRGESGVLSVAFSPDSRRLASSSADGSVRVWRLWSAAADFLCTRIWRNLSMDEWRFYVGGGISYERTCPALPPGVGVVGVAR